MSLIEERRSIIDRSIDRCLWKNRLRNLRKKKIFETIDDCDSVSKVDFENWNGNWMLYFSRIIEIIYIYIFLRRKNIYIYKVVYFCKETSKGIMS